MAAESGSPSKAISTQAALAAALARATFAIELDTAGKVTEAAEYYLAASNMLADIALDPTLEAGQRERTRELSSTYLGRLAKLALAPPTPSREIGFDETPIYVLNRPLPPPGLLGRRAYWLMRVWAKSILSGGYITPQLYVPRALWYQSGAKHSALPQKIDCCEQVLDFLLKLPSENLTDEPALAATLDEFVETLTALQNTLDKHLHVVVGVKKVEEASPEVMSTSQRLKDKMRRLGSTISKSATRIGNSVKLDDNTAYIELLVHVFTKSQFLDVWNETFKSSATIKPRLDRIAMFFYEVVCMFVLEDFNILLNRYTAQMRGSFLP